MYSALIYVGLLVSATLAVPSQELTDELQTSELKRLFGVKDLIDTPEYEIVYPQVLTSDENYDINTKAIAEDSLNINIEAFGETLLLTVHQDSSSFSPNFYAEEISGDGKPSVPRPVPPFPLDCLYKGKVASEPDSRVSLSTSSGLIAIIYHAKGPTFIEPIGEDLITNRGRPHVAYKQRDGSGMKCGVTDEHRGTEKFSFKTFEEAKRTKTMEVAIFTDNEIFTQKGNTIRAAVGVLINSVKDYLEAPMLGNTLTLRFVSLHIYTDNDPGLTNDFDASLRLACKDQFARNVKSDADVKHWDNAVYLSGHTQWDLLGIAFVSQCGDRWSTALVKWDDLVIETMAHELGHNLGMQHDGSKNACLPFGHIMSPIIQKQHTTWSTCSKDYLNARLQKTTCYDD